MVEQEVLDMFEEYGALHSIVKSAEFSPAYFISQIFNNQKGKPLRLLPFQMVAFDMLWKKKFPMFLMTRGGGKTFLLAVYAAVRALLVPGSKIVICGAGYRQAKLVFKYIEQLYEASPIFREAIIQWGGPKYHSDSAVLRVGLSTITAIPIGDGEKIRGMRATVLIADEFASIPEEIFEIVLSPFAAVHADPAERVATTAFIERLKGLGASEDLLTLVGSSSDFGNQVIVSGTATHKQNHFYKRFVVYNNFIASGGDHKKLKVALETRAMSTTGLASEIDNEDVLRMAETYKQYAVFQLPYNGLPKDFLDEDIIRSDRATFPRHRFAMEYEAQFPDDTDGFIKRSWIDRATPRLDSEGNGEHPVIIELYGDPRYQYILGFDAARWNDNCAVVVLKLTERGQELVYCDAWDRTDHELSAAKIREVCHRFPIQYIAMDKQGGGTPVRDELCKKRDNIPDEDLIWSIQDQLDRPSDMGSPGRNIIDMVNFSPAWISENAYSIEASIERRDLLFPHKGDDAEAQRQYMRHFNTEEVGDVVIELLQQDLWGVDDWEAENLNMEPKMGITQQVDECVNETCAIVKTVTPLGTEQFNLPKLANQPEGLDMRRRDRWSALMLANYAARVVLGHGHRPVNAIGRSAGHGVVSRKMNPITNSSVRRRGRTAF
jgi:hypothetical protein